MLKMAKTAGEVLGDFKRVVKFRGGVKLLIYNQSLTKAFERPLIGPECPY